MKRFVSILFCIVLIFALAVPSFAVAEPFAGDHNNTLDALNNIDYYIYWIFQDFTEDLTSIQDWLSDIWSELAGDINFELTAMRGKLTTINDDFMPTFNTHFTNMLSQLLDINDFTRANYDELDSFNSNFFGEVVHLTPFASSLTTLLEDISDTVVDESTETRILIEDSVMPQLLAQFSRLYLGITNFRTDFNNEFDHTKVDSSGYALYMLQQVLADEEDLEFKEDNETQKNNILDFAFEGVTGSEGSSLSFLSVGANSITTVRDFFAFFDMGRSSNGIIVDIFNDDDLWIWFSARNNSAINGSSVYSRNISEPEVVTNFYGENREKLDEYLRGLE